MNNIRIEKSALKTVLYGILSCQCPVTAETETALFQEFNSDEGELLSLGPYLDIASRNPAKTPLQLFVEFCAFSQGNPFSFVIRQDDALRYFSARYHFDRMAGSLDPLTITDPSAHLTGHMLLPVSPGEGENEFVFSWKGKRILLKGVYIPGEYRSDATGCFGLHFGTILSPLDARQQRMVELHLESIPEFSIMAERVEFIDYARYQGLGDYSSRIASRFQRSVCLSVS
ncbi:hypothetical protein [Marispirochaeta sp.]|uniref:hypothetical protein n=1 Tax=Marispirochaeta sp. TaxID=2038653 RepID=UPI0029C72444|nr:hypothetical protein [Marispirochaeta sp.]